METSTKTEYIVLVLEAGASTADKILADMDDDADCLAISESFDTNLGTYHALTVEEAIQVRDALDKALKSKPLADEDWKVR